MELFRKVDKKATCKVTAKFLKNDFPRLVRLSQQPVSEYDGLRSPTISDMPKGDSIGNSTETKLLKHVEEVKQQRNLALIAKLEVSQIMLAINATNRESAVLLKSLYVQHNSDLKTQLELGIEKTSYFDHYKPLALMEFAEAYSGGALLVFEDTNIPE